MILIFEYAAHKSLSEIGDMFGSSKERARQFGAPIEHYTAQEVSCQPSTFM